MSPALAGVFLTTAPPGKSLLLFFNFTFFNLSLSFNKEQNENLYFWVATAFAPENLYALQSYVRLYSNICFLFIFVYLSPHFIIL